MGCFVIMEKEFAEPLLGPQQNAAGYSFVSECNYTGIVLILRSLTINTGGFYPSDKISCLMHNIEKTSLYFTSFTIPGHQIAIIVGMQ